MQSKKSSNRRMMDLMDLSCIMVIFGGTGDLTHRKLIPALYNLAHEEKLPMNFVIVSVGRRDKSEEEYRNEMLENIKQHSRFKFDDLKSKAFLEKIFYRKCEFVDSTDYEELKSFLENIDKSYGTLGNRIFYMAVAPEHFNVIVLNIKAHDLAPNIDTWQRLVIEKPFGRDLETARALNKTITSVFRERSTYRIDHYLGKEMIQNIMVIRFANTMFESIWSSKYIDNIQISSSETVGIENRAGYYEKSGVLRDMIQNHMLQLLSIIAMEPPVNLETEAIRDEKVKVIRELEIFDGDGASANVIRGQFGPGVRNNSYIPGYRQEENVSPLSNTETFIAMKLHVRNFRWGDMPFYLRTGKRLPEKTIEIVIQLKAVPEILYFKDYSKVEPNLLIIRIQPREGVSFQFNGKKPGTGSEIEAVNMDYCQNCNTMNNSPEAYERLIFDVIRGESTLFTRWDEIEASWRFVDSIAKAWKEKEPDFPNYAAGTWGPVEANELLKKDNRKWWKV
jgi:glucose-6-phosphate 1-dehydrogenase